MKRLIPDWTFGLTLLFCAWAVPLRADTLTLVPLKDNTLYEDATGMTSNGSGAAFFAGVNGQNQIVRGLLAFDLSAIPPASTIQSVTLTIRQSNTVNNRPERETVELRRVLRDWGEGSSSAGDSLGSGGAGAQAAPRDATWLHTFYPTLRWNSQGGDFDDTASASMGVEGNGFYTLGSTAGMIADVQDWVNRPETNFGWALLGNESTARTAKRFDSREVGDPSRRPRLTVEFTPAPAAGALALVSAAFSVDETAATLAVGVVRRNGSAGQVSVQYATRDGSAAAGSDYQPASGTLVFDPGVTERSISVTILDDDVFEGAETILLELSNPGGGASLGAPALATLTIGDDSDLTDALHFAQFGAGLGFFSRIILINPDPSVTVQGRLLLRRGDGSPFAAVLDGENLPGGAKDFAVPAGGLRAFTSGGQSPPAAGSATVLSDRPLSGVILFGGDFGLAGVGAGTPLNGFLGAVEVDTQAGVDTGVAVVVLGDVPVGLTLELVDAQGSVLASAQAELPPHGQTARFVRQFDWVPAVDLSSFQGTIRVAADAPVAGIMIQTRAAPPQFATLPVVPR